uniref:Uncharacterized protein n=1 Tax=Arundo donax TaxID=35708 RepID=A0A0A9GK25_ARUDO
MLGTSMYQLRLFLDLCSAYDDAVSVGIKTSSSGGKDLGFASFVRSFVSFAILWCSWVA